MNLLREQQIVKLKKELIARYFYLMCIIFLVYIGIFIFYIKDSFLVYYLIGGITFLMYSWFIIQKEYSIENAARAYFIMAPLYNFYIMLQFWGISVAGFVWLVPLPFGAYIFFGKKEIVIYSIYALLTIIITFMLANLFTFNSIKQSPEKVHYMDILLFISNIVIIFLAAYYKDKIRSLEILSEIEEKEKISLPVTLEEKDIQYAESLFERIEKEIVENELFKDSKFNISILSTVLSVNNNYISKAIRHKGYNNFSNYINSHRIVCVKKLIKESDLEKVTLMYIYTEAGFLNQSTFNRIFKQFEGVTPTEYIQKMKSQFHSKPTKDYN